MEDFVESAHDDVARAAALRLHEFDLRQDVGRDVFLPLEQLERAEDGLERVVQLVRDAGNEDADGRKPLLPDHLSLERLQHLAHLAFLLDLPIECAVRLAQVRRHLDERVLELRELQVRHVLLLRRREIAVGDVQRVGHDEVADPKASSGSEGRTLPTTPGASERITESTEGSS